MKEDCYLGAITKGQVEVYLFDLNHKIPNKEKVEETKNPWFAYSNRHAQVGPSDCCLEPTLLGGLQQAHHYALQKPHSFHHHTVLVAP